MYIARWLLTAHTGHKKAAISLMQKWEATVGERIGWRPASVRLTSGVIGVAQSQIEFEVRVDSISDLESAWADMAKHPYHAQHLKELEPHIVSGSSVWHVLQVADADRAS